MIIVDRDVREISLTVRFDIIGCNSVKSNEAHALLKVNKGDTIFPGENHHDT